jgi:hypothetical protein
VLSSPPPRYFTHPTPTSPHRVLTDSPPNANSVSVICIAPALFWNPAADPSTPKKANPIATAISAATPSCIRSMVESRASCAPQRHNSSRDTRPVPARRPPHITLAEGAPLGDGGGGGEEKEDARKEVAGRACGEKPASWVAPAFVLAAAEPSAAADISPACENVSSSM